MRHRAGLTLATALLAAAVLCPERDLTPDGAPPVVERQGYRELCRLQADPRNMFTRIGPPSEQGLQMRLQSLATITVNYTGFTPAAQAAFAYAVEIWQSQLTSTAPIVVNATFTSSGFGPTTLGSAGPRWIFRDFTGATVANTWYANALANKLFGGDLSTTVDTAPETWEISARFNSAFAWYFGTDGNAPANQYDFATVVLHELGHGFGFYGSATVASGLGRIGRSGFPDIYDRFVENGAGLPILGFTSGTTGLAAQLTGNNLAWNGASGVGADAGLKPKLYIPATWAQGSSYSHLDDATYPAGTANSLMTHALAATEAIHDPGPITRGMFADEGWTVAAACANSLSLTSVTFGQTGGTGSVGVFAVTGCSWTATSNASWIAITSGSSGTNNGSVVYSVAANAGVARTGTLTIAGQTFTVTQGPTFSVSPSTLKFGAVKASGVLTSQTSAQTIRLTQTGSPNVTWTATPSQPWIQVLPATATGTGTFTVSIVNTAALPASGTVTGQIIVSAAGAANAPSLSVSLTLYAPGTSQRPVGVLDVPSGLTTVSGSIVVGGWAIDDVEIGSVEVYRDRLTGEIDPPTTLPAGHPATGKIYVATAEIVRTRPFGADTALFIDGARPDIEALFPSNPWSYRAGWGSLMLTWGLPNQGTGTYTLTAYAFDKDGTYPTSYGLLGTKTFTSDNRSTTPAAQKPFGALDAPFPGETVSGVKLTGGWALTQPAGCVVTTVRVGIDSAPLQAGIYGDPRLDLLAGFPTASFTNSPNAGTAYFLDTTTLTNGVHQIGYLVQDGCGHQDGVGSRFFTVFNAGGSLTTTAEAFETVALSPDAADVESPPERADAYTAFALTDRPATELAARTTDAAVAVARGYGDGGREVAPAETVAPDPTGARVITVRQLERVAVHLPAPASGPDKSRPAANYAGYQVARGRLRGLPVGSSLDTRGGIFYWQPGPANLGTYDLAFVRTDASGAAVQVLVSVAVRPDDEPRPAPAREDEVPAPGVPAVSSTPVPAPAEDAPVVPPESAPDAPAVVPEPVVNDAPRQAERGSDPPRDARPDNLPPGTAADAPRPVERESASARDAQPDGPPPAPATEGPRVGGGAWDDDARVSADAGADQVVTPVAGWASVHLEARAPAGDAPAHFRWSGYFGTLEGRTIDVTLPLGRHAVALAVERDGTTATDTVVVTVRDLTAPVIEPTISPAPDARGVVEGTATVTWTVTDPESGVVSLDGCGERRLQRSRAVSCIATNGAGQTTTRTLAIAVRRSRR